MNRNATLAESAEASPSTKPPASGRLDPTVAAEKALKERPVFSIRLQVYLSVFLLFAIVLASGLLTSTITSRVEQQIHLYEVTSNFLFELDQARRFEKNFFLHSTNLDDALEQVHSARRIARENAASFGGIVGQPNYDKINASLQAYEDRLTSLGSIKRDDPAGAGEIRNAEVEVHKNGRDIVTLATDLVEKEREELEKTISFSRHVQLYLLIFLLLCLVALGYLLIRRIVDPIGRFIEYLERIASGDYTPILPRRRYRDEFSALAIAINRMVEELIHRESVLVESHKLRAVGTLTAGVAHELNNPINNITLTSHTMLEDYARLSDQERQEMISDVIHEADRTKRIVASLLDFTRQSETKMEPLDLAEVVKKTLALAQNQLNLKGVRATLDIAPYLSSVHGDSQQLSQVVLNLVLNAVDASPKGGTLEVSVVCAKDENFVEIRVKDHGTGIPSHILPQIFDPFFTTKPKGKGVGLGLSICRGILERHGGELTVETESGKGATFSVHLPVTAFPLDFTEMKEGLEKRGSQ